jgi:hypothetical protein
MAQFLMNTTSIEKQLVRAVNDLKAQIGPGASFHLDRSDPTGAGLGTGPITAANASDLATSLALCAQVAGVLIFHYADHRATAPNTAGAHKVADATSLPDPKSVLDLASAITAANLAKSSYNTHRASTTYHDAADATNTIASADATDLASLQTLLNELKTDVNAHIISAPAMPSIRCV